MVMLMSQSSQSPSLHLSFFGGPYIRRNGEAIHLSHQSLLLATLLVYAGEQGLARDKLIGILWSQGRRQELRARLSQALYKLRHILGPDSPYEEMGDRLYIRPKVFLSDLTSFEDMLRQSDIAGAMTLARMGFCSSIEERPCTDDLSIWLAQARAAVEETLFREVERRLQEALRCGDYRIATTVLELGGESLVNHPSVAWLALRGAIADGSARTAVRFLRSHGITVLSCLPHTPTLTPLGSSTELLQHLEKITVGLGLQDDPPPPVLGDIVTSLSERLQAGRLSIGGDQPRIAIFSEQEDLVHLLFRRVQRHLGGEGICCEITRLTDICAPSGGTFGTRYVEDRLLRGAQALLVLPDPDFVRQRRNKPARVSLDGSKALLISVAGERAGTKESERDDATVPNCDETWVLPALCEQDAARLLRHFNPWLMKEEVSRGLACAGGNLSLLFAWLYPLLTTEMWGQADFSGRHLGRPLSDLPLGAKKLLVLLLARKSWSERSAQEVMTLLGEDFFKSVRLLEGLGLAESTDGFLVVRVPRLTEWQPAYVKTHLATAAVEVKDTLLALQKDRVLLFDLQFFLSQILPDGHVRPYQAGGVGESSPWVGRDVSGERWTQESETGSWDVESPRSLGEELIRKQDWERAATVLRRDRYRALEEGDVEMFFEVELQLLRAEGHQPGVDVANICHRLERLVEGTRRAMLWDTATEGLNALLHFHHRQANEPGVNQSFAEARAMLRRGGLDTAAVTRLHGLLAMMTFYGNPRAGLLHAREAVESAELWGDDKMKAFTLNRLIAVLLARGRLRTQEGRSALDAAAVATTLARAPAQDFHLQINRGVWEADCGNYGEAFRLLEGACSYAQTMQDRKAEVLATCNLALAKLRAGDRLAAAHQVAAGQAALDAWSSLEVRVQFAAMEGLLALEAGKISDAKTQACFLQDLRLPTSVDRTPLTDFRVTLYRRLGRKDLAWEALREALAWTKRRFPTHFVGLVARYHDNANWDLAPREERQSLKRQALRLATALNLREWELRLRAGK